MAQDCQLRFRSYSQPKSHSTFYFKKLRSLVQQHFFLSLKKHYPVDCSFFSHFSDTECAASLSNLDDQVAQVSRCL